MPETAETSVWRQRAECIRWAHTDVWAADDGTQLMEAALAVCGLCAVQRECREHMLAIEELEPPSHIWGAAGGLTARQRRRIIALRRRARARAGAIAGTYARTRTSAGYSPRAES